jgi:hypothetical protein
MRCGLATPAALAAFIRRPGVLRLADGGRQSQGTPVKRLLTAIAITTIGLSASAQTLQGISLEPSRATVGAEVALTARFDVSSAQNCNVRIEFGDGAQQNFVVNQAKDATMVLKHRYTKPGSYTVLVKPVTKLPALKCLGEDQQATVVVTAAAAGASAKAAAAAQPAAPQCPSGWTLDKRSVNRKTGAFTCRAKPGTAAPEGKLACPGELGYFENTKTGQLGCRP